MKLFELTKKNFTLFGWLSIIISIITIPALIIALILGFLHPEVPSGNPLGSLVTLISTIIYSAIFYFFKILLNKKYKFLKADRTLMTFIILNLLSTLILEILYYIPGTEIAVGIFAAISLVAIGIISIALGVKLLSLNNTLYGLKKSLTINLILSGILYASVVLIFIAIIPSLIINALLGVLFLREAASMESKK